MSRDNCFQSRQVTGGVRRLQHKEPAEMMHMPLRPLGFFCEKHCSRLPLPGTRVVIAPILQRHDMAIEPRRSSTPAQTA